MTSAWAPERDPRAAAACLATGVWFELRHVGRPTNLYELSIRLGWCIGSIQTALAALAVSGFVAYEAGEWTAARDLRPTLNTRRDIRADLSAWSSALR
jgi:hypothetical protein